MAVFNVGSNGKAPSGLSVGDTVATGGNGMFQIVHPGTPGARYDRDTGYSSININGNFQDALTAYSQANSERNSAKSQEFAREQMAFQDDANAKSMRFSAEQAQLNRDWQERMSNTAHQREVADLVAAGLNPVLSAMNGNGATSPSGSSASGVTSGGASGNVDNSNNSMIGALLSAVINQATALQSTAMSNQTALQTTAMSNQTALASSKLSASAILGSANINAKSNQYIQQVQNAFEAFLKQKYPQTVTGGISSIVQDGIKAFNKAVSSGKDSNGLKTVLQDMYDSFVNPDWGIFN